VVNDFSYFSIFVTIQLEIKECSFPWVFDTLIWVSLEIKGQAGE